MKKTSKVFVLLISLVLVLCGCTNKSNETPTTQWNLGGKTFYSQNDAYESVDVSSVWFGKDGSFVLKDNYFDGWYEITGNWTINEDVLTLDVSSTPVGDFSKIRFEITDESELVLKTSLAGSQSDTVFKDTKPEPGDAKVLIYTFYYNVNQGSTNMPNLELRSDGTFTLKDQNDFSIFDYNGTYVLFGNNLILNLDHEIDGQTQIFMDWKDENTFVLLTDLGISRNGDRFCMPGTDPAIPGPEGAPSLENSEWRHEKITDMIDDYLPSIKFDSAGMFDFTENLYSGFGHFIGWYEKTDKAYICHVDDASTVQGFAGADTKLIEFELVDENTIILKTDLCMSMSGEKFERISSH
ncbi:MAG: hypothetical protein IJI44_01480 [Erysipelotrichaceae bacterium]|nr:hypothetical protein [Erysipelotrichaceae bacterium]